MAILKVVVVLILLFGFCSLIYMGNEINATDRARRYTIIHYTENGEVIQEWSGIGGPIMSNNRLDFYDHNGMRVVIQGSYTVKEEE